MRKGKPFFSHPSGDSLPTVARLEFLIRAVPFRRRRNRLIASRASGPYRGGEVQGEGHLTIQLLATHPPHQSPSVTASPQGEAGEACRFPCVRLLRCCARRATNGRPYDCRNVPHTSEPEAVVWPPAVFAAAPSTKNPPRAKRGTGCRGSSPAYSSI